MDRRFVEEDVSDEMLLGNVADGDKAAMHIMFARHRAAVSQLIQRMVGDRAIAGDLVGQVFLDVWRSANRLESRARVSTWLLLISRLKTASSLPEPAHQSVDKGDGPATADARDTPEAALGGRKSDRILNACVGRLSPAHREIIGLIYDREKSIAEVSEIVGIPDATARSRLLYARKQLAKILVSVGLGTAADPTNTDMRAARPSRRLHPNMRSAAILNSKAHRSITCPQGEHIMRALALSVLVLVCSFSAVHAARSSAAFNGSWDLAFVTQSGTCDPSYNFTVNISNGLVTHPNLVRFRGYVQSSGSVRASVAVQDKYASGSGRLSGSSGKGTWTGRSGNSRCVGYWTAQRN